MQPEKHISSLDVARRGRRKGEIFFFKLPSIIARDGRYVAYDNGIVCDCFSSMEWFAGPNDDTNWYEADRWANTLSVGGGGWTLATIDQLSNLYCKNKKQDRLTPLLNMQPSDVWSSEVHGESSAWGFNFIPGNSFKTYRTYKSRFRALAVRKKPYYR